MGAGKSARQRKGRSEELTWAGFNCRMRNCLSGGVGGLTGDPILSSTQPGPLLDLRQRGLRETALLFRQVLIRQRAVEFIDRRLRLSILRVSLREIQSVAARGARLLLGALGLVARRRRSA